MLIISPKLLTTFPALILRLGLQHQIPLAYHRKALVEQGALLSYGPNYVEVGQGLATYIDRILKGAKPADVVLVHAPKLELEYLAKGTLINRRLVIRNDYVLLGPSADPAKVRGLKSAAEAPRRDPMTGKITPRACSMRRL